MSEQRKLAAILACDVVGFSRLTSVDEDRTLARLRALRSDLIDPTISVHNGRVVKRTGDGALVEFRSVVDAVRCAIEIQTAMIERNTGLPEDRRILFRVGIHLGDVVEENDGDLMGDGVNIAARLEGIAAPGAICLSEDAYRQVKSRLDILVHDMGPTHLKNIAEAVRVYALQLGVPAPVVQAAAVATPEDGPVKPSLAVMPFANLSGDPEQDYFADGVVEDIITALSKFHSFAVIARNATFAYKGRVVGARLVAEELSVRYVLEGSVRRAGSRLRIGTQLIEAADLRTVWAHQFDGPVEDVFDFQDRITENVVALVEPNILRAEIELARRMRPESLAAYDLYLRALPDVFVSHPEANVRAIALLERAIGLDPRFSQAMAFAAHAYLLRIVMQYEGSRPEDRERAVELARAALDLTHDDATVLGYCGFVLVHIAHEYDGGLAVLRRALQENPNNIDVLNLAGIGELMGGDLTVAAQCLERALRLDPNGFSTHWQMTGMAHVRMAEGRYEAALDWAVRSLAINPHYDPTYWMLIAANAHLGRLDEARRHVAGFLAVAPKASLARIRQGQRLRDPHRLDVLIDGMRLAGLPE